MDPEAVNYHYCDDLETRPLPSGTRVLVTGAKGYVARRLIPELVHRGYFVRCLFHNRHTPVLLTHPRIERVYGDCLRKEQLLPALQDIEVAYYLVHHMQADRGEFARLDREAAECFAETARAQGVKKIIYLGGLGAKGAGLSPHLSSRMEVGDILQQSGATVISLHAAIILGTGSTSYELLKALILHNAWIPFLPEFNSRCQPAAIRDVIKYLVGVMEKRDLPAGDYPIGGQDVLPYQQLIELFAGILGEKARFFDVSWVPLPVRALCRIYAYWLHLFTPVPVNVIALLLDGLANDVVCGDTRIRELLPFEPLSIGEALRRAQEKEKKLQVFSHWSDVPPAEVSDHLPLCEYEASKFMIDEHTVDIAAPAAAVFALVTRIGGQNGWYHGNALWEIRGFIDRLLGGVGLQRGRRCPDTLKVGDALDFWRVERLEMDKELLLRAEMISPGLSWLQFELQPAAACVKLILRAHFIPMPVLGHLYWHVLSGFHDYIFRGMLRHFKREAERQVASGRQDLAMTGA